MNLNYLRKHAITSCPFKPTDPDKTLSREHFILDESQESLNSDSSSDDQVPSNDLDKHEPDSLKRFKSSHEEGLSRVAQLIHD